MLGRSLVQHARRVLVLQAKRNHGHDVPANPGPPCNYDMWPIPSQSYAKVHAELQSKFNTYLAVSLTLLAGALGTAVYTDLWSRAAYLPPRSWRERNKSN